MNEKVVRLTCYGMIIVITGEAAALTIHYEQNLECRPPVDQAGCFPGVPEWLLKPHNEQNDYTSTAPALMSAVVSSTGTPSGLDWR